MNEEVLEITVVSSTNDTVFLKVKLRGDKNWLEYIDFVPVGGVLRFVDGQKQTDPRVIATPRKE